MSGAGHIDRAGQTERSCAELGLCQSRRCADCPELAARLPFRQDDDAQPERAERVVIALFFAAWVVCLGVTLLLAARACGGVA